MDTLDLVVASLDLDLVEDLEVDLVAAAAAVEEELARCCLLCCSEVTVDLVVVADRRVAVAQVEVGNVISI